MILNVGPAADGQIPLLQQERLLQLGSWLAVNGEAIYGSRPWHKTGEKREVTMERVDPTIDFDWVRNAPGRPISEDQFTATWTGYLQAPKSEAYTLEAEADDGLRVWLDDHLVIDQWGAVEGGVDPGQAEAEAGQDAGGVVRLEAGEKVPILIEYREEDLQASVRLFWSSPGQERTIIPRERLFTTLRQDDGDGLKAVYRSQQQHVAYTTKNSDLFAIIFDWPDSELALPVPEPEPDAVIRLLGIDRELPWHYEGDTLFVDFTGIAAREVPGRWAWTLRLPLPPEDDAAHQECRGDAQIQGTHSDEERKVPVGESRHDRAQRDDRPQHQEELGREELPDLRFPERGDTLQVPSSTLMEDESRLQGTDDKAEREPGDGPQVARAELPGLQQQAPSLEHQNHTPDVPGQGG